ncbi:four helix bundle protein [Nonlabens spongiae]|uniref:Four helix bundle protein n=1 Tax=Nonlabens spongiae TaxID=331648 RepID=A0A1W6MHR4_9FLAO|nr:four helix bundle protein [Nonlabens spongiae]ARN77164.1 four helix bundle protein [Nonlabens spongiae]
MNAQTLEDRLIEFAANIISASKQADKSFAAEHLSKQLIRSATSVALNYGEARGGESTRDYLHKMKICLKELRESYVNLKIQKLSMTITNQDLIENLIDENNQLISIFVVSIKNTKTN